MILDETILKGEERASLALRALYAASGYRQYRMSRFEEYDLYSKNKDFLLSENVITFTDTNGRLKALKPDVTLSIIRNTRHLDQPLTKVYYNENVYRVSKSGEGFRELMQTGLECIGQIGRENVVEVLSLAARSLRLLSPNGILAVSHLDVLSQVIGMLGLPQEDLPELLKTVGEKNLHGIDRLCGDRDGAEILKALLQLEGPAQTVLPELQRLLQGTPARDSAEKLTQVLLNMGPEIGQIHLDFSVVGDMRYYNGIVFQGRIEGIPGSVLSGGQYDRLMRRLNRRSGAVGFAVYLDLIERPAGVRGEADALC